MTQVYDEVNLTSIIETMLFVSREATSIKEIINKFPENSQPSKVEVQDALLELTRSYEDHAIELVQVASGYRFQVRQQFSSWVGSILEEKPAKLSRAFLETLSLIAYRQPITRGEIEAVRGVVVSSNIIRTLLDFEWIREVGHKEIPGRPTLFATTKTFLDDFGLKSLDELPELQDIKDLAQLAQDLDSELDEETKAAIAEIQQQEQELAQQPESELNDAEATATDIAAETASETEIAAESDPADPTEEFAEIIIEGKQDEADSETVVDDFASEDPDADPQVINN